MYRDTKLRPVLWDFGHLTSSLHCQRWCFGEYQAEPMTHMSFRMCGGVETSVALSPHSRSMGPLRSCRGSMLDRCLHLSSQDSELFPRPGQQG